MVIDARSKIFHLIFFRSKICSPNLQNADIIRVIVQTKDFTGERGWSKCHGHHTNHFTKQNHRYILYIYGFAKLSGLSSLAHFLSLSRSLSPPLFLSSFLSLSIYVYIHLFSLFIPDFPDFNKVYVTGISSGISNIPILGGGDLAKKAPVISSTLKTVPTTKPPVCVSLSGLLIMIG